jgi:hypothetical protein
MLKIKRAKYWFNKELFNFEVDSMINEYLNNIKEKSSIIAKPIYDSHQILKNNLAILISAREEEIDRHPNNIPMIENEYAIKIRNMIDLFKQSEKVVMGHHMRVMDLALAEYKLELLTKYKGLFY